jgi:hypothetical protein
VPHEDSDDSEEPWHEIECACNQREDCELCDGAGLIELRRAASRYVGPRELFVVRAATMVESGLSPWAEAGWSEWPAVFVDAISIALNVRSECFEEEMRRRHGKRTR